MSSPSLFKPNTIPLGNRSNQCSKCPRYVGDKKGICQYHTNIKPCKVLFVYFEPTTQAFTYSNWSYAFRQSSVECVIAKIGVDAVAFTGARQCPNKKGVTTNRNPCGSHALCRSWLDKEIKRYKPSVIIPIGFKATGAVLHAAFPYSIGTDASGGTYMGHQIPSGIYNAWICPIISATNGEDYDLTYTSKKNNIERDAPNKQTVDIFIQKHVRDAIKLIDKRPFPMENFDPTPTWVDFDPTRQDKKQLGIIEITSPEELKTIVQQYCGNKEDYAAFDYECNALSPKCSNPRILTASMAFGDQENITAAYAFTFTDKRFIEPWVDFLKSPVRKVGANIKFEETWGLSYFNQAVKNWHWDVGVAGHIQDITPGTAGLKYMSLAFFGVGGYDNDVGAYIKGEKDNMYSTNTLERCPRKTLLLYNAIDSIMTLKIMYKQKQELAIDEKWNRWNLWQK